jgi:hypothetical protein
VIQADEGPAVGAVRYEVDRLDAPIAHCHCVTCRKAHASAFATTARVLRENFRWTAGAALLRSYESSPGKHRHFCSTCGTQFIAERPAQLHIILRVPTLDDDPGVRATVHIWTSQSPSRLQDEDGMPRYPEWPPSR